MWSQFPIYRSAALSGLDISPEYLMSGLSSRFFWLTEEDAYIHAVVQKGGEGIRTSSEWAFLLMQGIALNKKYWCKSKGALS